MAGPLERFGGVAAAAGGFRWRKLLEIGANGTFEEIAAAEKINSSYVSRLLRMTLLTPEIVEAIPDGRQPAQVTLAVLMGPIPVCWREQRSALQLHSPRSSLAVQCAR